MYNFRNSIAFPERSDFYKELSKTEIRVSCPVVLSEALHYGCREIVLVSAEIPLPLIV